MFRFSLSSFPGAGSAPAIALYEKLGFREVGRRKNYYRAEHEDALLMTVEFDRHG